MLTDKTQGRAERFSNASPYLSLLITMVMFGSAFASSKFVVGELPHEVAAALRFGGGGVLLMVLTMVLHMKSKPIGWGSAISAAFAGLLGVFAYNLFFFWGLSLAPSIDGSVIVPVLSPIITTAILITLGREKTSGTRILGLFLGLVGAAIFLFGAGTAESLKTRMIGDLFFVVGALSWALYSIVSKSLLSKGTIDPLRATTWATATGSVALIALALPHVHAVDWSSVSRLAWYNIAYLCVGPTAIAYLLYYYGLQRVSASTATIMMFTVPFFGSFFSILFLGESIRGIQMTGATVMLAGSFIAVILAQKPTETGSRKPLGGSESKLVHDEAS